MSNTCDTCKWWTGDSSTDIDPPGMKQCMHFKVGSEEREDDWLRAVISINDGCASMAHDYYPAYFLCGPKFGCIHHEPK